VTGLCASWRDDLDALHFRPAGHEGACMVHRLAFRRLTGAHPSPEECRAYFARHRSAFERAARAKIVGRSLPSEASLHLTSRDVLRQLTCC
jgi:hypothetical protein